MNNNVQIICIGDELLIGQVINTNAAWLGSKLTHLGFNVINTVVIKDNEEEIIKCLNNIDKNISLAIFTGGLGPTTDDITKNTFCKYFGSELVRNNEIENHIKQIFENRKLPVTETNLKQADVPNNCEVLFNNLGTAPGMIFNKNNLTVISLPGVPFEMKYIIENEAVNYLKKKFDLKELFSETVVTTGIAESFLSDKLIEWEENLKSNKISIAYLPKPGMVRLRITSEKEKNEGKKDVLEAITELHNIIPNKIYCVGDFSPEEYIGILLQKNNLTLCTAESCTGGYIAHLITSIAGSSKYFKGSVIAYSNEVKENILKVDSFILNLKGAVSIEVVKAMAENVRKILNTDYSIAVSGIAGPDGGTLEKPVGTVCIAVATKCKTITKKELFGNDRLRNIERTAISALNMLKLLIEEAN